MINQHILVERILTQPLDKIDQLNEKNVIFQFMKTHFHDLFDALAITLNRHGWVGVPEPLQVNFLKLVQ